MPDEVRELIGYTDEWAVRPGDQVTVMVSTTAPEYEAALVRLRHGDDRPHAPGLKETVVTSVPAMRCRGRRQFAALGSFAHVADAPALDELTSFTAMAWIWPTTPGDGHEQGIVSCLGRDGSRGWALLVSSSGEVAVKIGGPDGGTSLSSGRSLLRRHWYLVCATFDRATGTLRVFQLPQPGSLRDYESAVAQCEVAEAIAAASGSLTIGALSARPDVERRTRGTGHYNGKVDVPLILADAVNEETVAGWHVSWNGVALDQAAVVAAWDLGSDPAASTVPDRGPHRMDAHLVNMPMRAVTGHTWSGRHHDFRTRPQEYTAIHFHADDLEDAEWTPDFTLRLPDDLRSGTYAIRLRGGGMVDRIPLFVRPPVGTATARVALILPTLTYLAYGNNRSVFNNKEFRESGLITRDIAPDPRDFWLRGRPDLGISLYDTHVDGSGSCYASRRRPLIGLRPDFVNWMTGAPRHFGADLYIVDWLQHLGVDYDVICDEDVHTDGQESLQRYRVLITGSHPEYCTEQMLDAFQGYLNNGGRLMYLGGNGFYWATSIDPTRPHVMEVRRGVAGTRPWDSEPGEFHHSTTGEPGGLWRHRGRPPNQLVGVGFCAQSRGTQSEDYLVRTWDDGEIAPISLVSSDGDCKEVRASILRLENAVGDEVDHVDERLGSPPSTAIVAECDSLEGWGSAVEDCRFAGGQSGTTSRPRSHLALMTSPNDGLVFAASSIAWAVSMRVGNGPSGTATISRSILEKMLRRNGVAAASSQVATNVRVP